MSLYGDVLRLLGECAAYAPDDLRLRIDVALQHAGATVTPEGNRTIVTFPYGEPPEPERQDGDDDDDFNGGDACDNEDCECACHDD